MKYIVNFGINKFKFDDGQTALSFAELGKKYFVPTEYNSSMKPCITVEGEEDDERHDIQG